MNDGSFSQIFKLVNNEDSIQKLDEIVLEYVKTEFLPSLRKLISEQK